MYTTGILPTTSFTSLRDVSVYSTHGTGVEESFSTDDNNPHKIVLPVSTIQKVNDPPQQPNNSQPSHLPFADQQYLTEADQKEPVTELEELAFRQAIEIYKNNVETNKELAAHPAPEEKGAKEKIIERNFIEEIRERQLAAQLVSEENDAKEKVDERNFIEEIRERQLLNTSMISYRQSLVKHYNPPQSSSLPSSTDSEAQPSTENRVLLYNQSISAYIRQKIYFSSINNVGLMTKV